MTGSKRMAPLLIAATLAAGALAGASVAYEYEAGTHGTAAPVSSGAVLAIDAAGVLVLFVFAWQVLLGYGFFPEVQRQVAAHGYLAVPLLGLVALHGAGAMWHAAQPPREGTVLLLAAMGLVAAAGLAWQWFGVRRHLHERAIGHSRTGRIAEAGAQSRMSPGEAIAASSRPRRDAHVPIALVLGVIVLVHGSLGVYHAVTG